MNEKLWYVKVFVFLLEGPWRVTECEDMQCLPVFQHDSSHL